MTPDTALFTRHRHHITRWRINLHHHSGASGRRRPPLGLPPAADPQTVRPHQGRRTDRGAPVAGPDGVDRRGHRAPGPLDPLGLLLRPGQPVGPCGRIGRVDGPARIDPGPAGHRRNPRVEVEVEAQLLPAVAVAEPGQADTEQADPLIEADRLQQGGGHGADGRARRRSGDTSEWDRVIMVKSANLILMVTVRAASSERRRAVAEASTIRRRWPCRSPRSQRSEAKVSSCPIDLASCSGTTGRGSWPRASSARWVPCADPEVALEGPVGEGGDVAHGEDPERLEPPPGDRTDPPQGPYRQRVQEFELPIGRAPPPHRRRR